MMEPASIKAAIVFVLLALGVSVPAHEFLGGMLLGMGMCYGVMIISEPQDRKTLWATLVVGFLGTILAAILYPSVAFVNWLPLQAIMGISGALSRFIAEGVIEFGTGLKERARSIPGMFKLPGGKK